MRNAECGMRKWFILAVLLSLFHVNSLSANADRGASIPMGINLTSVCYWSTEHPFMDIFKTSQPWRSQRKGAPYGKGGILDLDSKGWVQSLQPGQWADALLCRCGGHYPAGEYICLYDGEGVLDFAFDATVKRRKKGRIVLNVSPSGSGILVRLLKTNPQNPISNIRIIRSEFENKFEQQIFQADFLKRWRGFEVIRFMDWMRTNNSIVETWSQRPTQDMQTQGSDRGVALEYMILLANQLKADPWFCMPHEADHEYIAQFARMVKEKLNPDLKVYVEYSNEVWNYQFKQAHYAARVGQGMHLGDTLHEAGLYFYAKRATEIFQIWVDVFGSADRLVRVLSAQNTNPWTSKKILSFKNAYRYADALAIAPYFGSSLGKPENQNKTCGMNIDQVLNECRKSIKRQHAKVREHAALAKTHHLNLIAYEGGQHLAGKGGTENNPRLTALFLDVNRDPKMKALYLQDLNAWKQAGGGLFNAFSSMTSYGKWGSWGLLEHENQNPATAPKYQAVLEFMGRPP